MDNIAVAKILMSRRNAQHSFVVDGDTLNKLGSDGVNTATRNGWLDVDQDLSIMSVSNRNGVYADISRLALEPGDAQSSAPEPIPQPVHGQTLPDAMSSVMPFTRESYVREEMTYAVGDDVVVVDQGKSYVGKVQAIKTDGKLVLSFTGQKPVTSKSAYDKNEVAKQDRKQTSSPTKPQTPVTYASTQGPAAPGLSK